MYYLHITQTIDGESFDLPSKTFQTLEAVENDLERIQTDFEKEFSNGHYRTVGAGAELIITEGSEVIRHIEIKRPRNSPKTMVYNHKENSCLD